MVVFPVQYDQFRNAGLVDRHRMGVIANTNTISEEALRKDILSVLNSEEIDGNIKKMKALFHREEAARQGVDIIEQLI
jgi:UDP:flavonoid glycosyltransferase YjiC (YdhE family)